MKCIYYLASTLSSTRAVADDLHELGIDDFYLHVIAKDEAGLKGEHIHSGNYLETLDLVRDGSIGALLGFAAGLLGVGLLMYFRPFGPQVEVPAFAYVALVGAATLFGSWEGGLIGIGKESRKLAQFHDDLEAGNYLILIYVRKHQESAVRSMMQRLHPDARLVGIDVHFVNPFSPVERLPGTALPQGLTRGGV